MLVQTRESIVLRPTQALGRFAIGLLAVSVALVLSWSVFFAWRRRSRRPVENRLD